MYLCGKDREIYKKERKKGKKHNIPTPTAPNCCPTNELGLN